MRKSAFLVAGIAIGVFVAKQIESNPETKKVLDSAAAKVKDFSNAVTAGYKEQEAKASRSLKRNPSSVARKSPTASKRAR